MLASFCDKLKCPKSHSAPTDFGDAAITSIVALFTRWPRVRESPPTFQTIASVACACVDCGDVVEVHHVATEQYSGQRLPTTSYHQWLYADYSGKFAVFRARHHRRRLLATREPRRLLILCSRYSAIQSPYLLLSSSYPPVTQSYAIDSPLSPSVTPSLFHSRLQTHLFQRFFPPLTLSL